MTIDVIASPHPGQREVHEHPARFKVLGAGRRWGKTRLGVYECIDVASHGGRAWWVAPSYKMSEVGWRPLRKMGFKIGAEVRKVDRQIILPGGGEVTVRSADKPDSLRGEGLDLVVLDECAYIHEDAWVGSLRPALADRQGSGIFISTPKGRNWFWRLFVKGQSGDDEWMSWQLPTSQNPYIPPGEIEAAKQSMPEILFRQEFLAEFLDNQGAIFRLVQDAATANKDARPQDHKRHRIVFGVDWGIEVDFTAIIGVCSNCKEQVLLDRFNRIDFAFQTARLKAHVDRWKPALVNAERNSFGIPLVEQLYRDGIPITSGIDGKLGFNTSATTKPPLIEDLAMAIEKGDLQIFDDPVLINELLAYERTTNKLGKPSYNAPEGVHDDTVMALALAWNAAVRGGFDLY